MLSTSLSVIGIEDGVFLGQSPGFDGTIKREPSDFIVNEIDTSGRLVEVSNFDTPPPLPPPPAPPAPTPAPPPSAPASSSTPPPVSTPPLGTATPPPSTGTGKPTTGTTTTTTATTTPTIDAIGDPDQGNDHLRQPASPGGDAATPSQALRGVALDGVFAYGQGGATGVEVSWSDQLRGIVDPSALERLERIDAEGRACCWAVAATSSTPAAATATATATATASATATAAANASAIAAAAKPVEYVAANAAVSVAAGQGEEESRLVEGANGGRGPASGGGGGVAEAGREAGGGEEIEPVRIFAGHGADKTARWRVHRAVQEIFPFVKTSTEKDTDGGVTVVCTRATTLPVLGGLVTEPELESLQRMVNRGPGGEGAEKGITLSSDKDRTNRTLVHRAIAEAFPYLQTKTCSDAGDSSVQRISVFWSRRPHGGKRKRGRSDGSDGSAGRAGGADRVAGRNAASNSCPQGEATGGGGRAWVRFALRKEGQEHHRMATSLAKALRVPLSCLSFGGIKDKMGITTQVCAVRGVPPSKITKSNGSVAGVTVGNLSYCDRGLSLGELSGNRFAVVIRGANLPAARVEVSLREACSTGFVNFFGTQRVGAPSASARRQPLPYQIGRDLLSGDWEAAVRKVLLPRDSDPPFLRSALSELLQGKISPKKCAARVKGNNRLSAERLVLHGLVRYGASAFQAAIQCVPYGMRTMWVHAYQSHVWNSVASARVRLFGPQAVPGDLVLPAESSIPRDAAEPSPTPGGLKASAVGCGTPGSLKASDAVEVGTAGVKAPTAEGGGLEERKEEGLEAAGKEERRGLPGVFGSSNRGGQSVVVLTKAAIDEAAAKGITPRDLLRRVVLPLPGTSISYPSHEARNIYKRRLDQDGVDPLMCKDADPEAPVLLSTATASTPDVMTEGEATPTQLVTSIGGASPTATAPQMKGPRGGATVAAAAVTVASSALVPRGAYRRLLCVPVDAQWSAAPPAPVAEKKGSLASGARESTGSESFCDRDSYAGDRTTVTSSGASCDPSRSGDGAGGAALCGRDSLAGGGTGGEALHDRASGAGGASDGGDAPAEDRRCGGLPTCKDVEEKGLGQLAGTDPGIVEDVCMSFTLPPGSFATMFLRELMKRDDDVAWGGGTKKVAPGVSGADG